MPLTHAQNCFVTSPHLTKKWKQVGQKKGSPDVELVVCTTDGVICAPLGHPAAQLTLGTTQQRWRIPA